jgi:hypothetical protein
VIPSLNRNPSYTIRIPELSGGINWRDGASQINDNQLTDAKNVWYRNGVLVGRAKLRNTTDIYNTLRVSESKDTVKVFTFKHCTKVHEGVEYILEFIFDEYANAWWIRYANASGGVLQIANGTWTGGASFLGNVVAAQRYEHIYFYFEEWGDTTRYTEIWDVYPDNNGYFVQKNPAVYEPIVLTNCFPVYNSLADAQTMISKGATQVEGFNLLGNRYRIECSTYDASENGYTVDVGSSDGTEAYISYMEYGLPFTTHGCFGEISVKYTDSKGTHNYSVLLPQNANFYAEKKNEDGLYMCVYLVNDTYRVAFAYFKDEPTSIEDLTSDKYATINKTDYINNNMVISAPCENPIENQEKVCAMTQAVWYGNSATGINGGNRLFLCGNTKEKEKALVIWSDFDNPLYFSENNYAYVGDKNQSVTAFGKQGSSLIIFKENETYSTQYTEGSVTAEELYNQSVIDITTRTAYFPMTLIHPTIGCDCPNSIQLCRNRLVFAHSSGHVYTITSQNQYSERNIYEVSEMVSRKMPKGEWLKNSMSADWNGYYMLFVPFKENGIEYTKGYVMDYNSYGFSNIASYTKQNEASTLIPWYYWEIPIVPLSINTIGTDIYMCAVRQEVQNCYVITLTLDENAKFDTLYENLIGNPTQKSYPVPTMIQTKSFDFGNSAIYKIILQADVAFKYNEGKPITVSFITDSNMPDTHIAIVQKDIENKCFVPYTKILERIGIRIQCDGDMSVDSISLKYKQAGGIKWR